MGAMAASAAVQPPIERRVEQLAARVSELAEARGRSWMAQRLQDEMRRLSSRGATVVVAGETGKGKSSLINALLGRPGLLPVGPSSTINVRLAVRHSATAVARVYREGAEALDVPLEALPRWATVAENPENAKGVQLVEVAVDDALLAQGLTIVDTPGVGGLDSAHGAITASAVSQAEALIFVVDASAPFVEPELSFLEQVTDRLETVIFALTKRDLYAGWQAVRGQDRELLATRAPTFADAPFIPLSSRAQLEADAARGAGDYGWASELAAQSGFGDLRTALVSGVIARSNALRLRNAVKLSICVLSDLRALENDVVAAAGGDSRLQEDLGKASQRKQEFSRAKRISAVAVSDEFARLGHDLTREFNRMLTELRVAHERKIRLGKVKSDALANDLDVDLRSIVARLEVRLREGVDTLVCALAQEIGLTVTGADAALHPPSRLAATADGDPGGRPRDWTMNFMPALFGVVTVPGTVGVVAGLIPAAAVLAPVAAAAGLALIPVNLVQRRRVRDQQDAGRLLRDAIERARNEVPPLLAGTLLALRRQIEQDLETAIAQREQELAEAVERQKRLAHESLASRTQVRNAAQARIKELHRLRVGADALERELSDQAAWSSGLVSEGGSAAVKRDGPPDAPGVV